MTSRPTAARAESADHSLAFDFAVQPAQHRAVPQAVYGGDRAEPAEQVVNVRYGAPSYFVAPSAAAGLPGGNQSLAGGANSTLADEVEYVSGLTAGGVVSALTFTTWNSDNPATYNPDTSTVFKFGNATAGTASGNVTYYFDPASNWTTTEKDAFVSGMTIWTWVANVTFVETSNQAAAKFTIRRDPAEEAGYATLNGSSDIGSSTLDTTPTGELVVGGALNIGGPLDDTGGYPWTTIMHEIGHVLGLGHGGAYNGDVNPATQQFGIYDNTAYTIMSYIAPDDATAQYFGDYVLTGTSWGETGDGYPQLVNTPMMLDILAMQRLYGAPVNGVLNGGDIFGFNTNLTGAAAKFFDFSINTTPVITVFSTGLNNVLDLSGFTQNAVVNLTSGAFSSAAGMVNNIAIALNTIVETAIGGTGRDTLNGGTQNNTLNGGGGNDTLNGAAGNDSLNGGTGIDRMNGGTGNDIFYVDSASDVIIEATGQGTDKILTSVTYVLATGVSIETMATTLNGGTASMNLTGNELGQRIVGNSGSNILDGKGGIDQLQGLAGNDTYRVDNAGDVVSEAGNQGSDTVQASVTYTLAANQSIEVLSTNSSLDVTAINLTGNDLAQQINGNAGINTLTGGGGNDTLSGAAGNDVLNGGTGDDVQTGGAGRDTHNAGAGFDTYRFTSVADSTGVNRDLVVSANLTDDVFDFTVQPTVISAQVNTGSLSTATFDADLAAAVNNSFGSGNAIEAVLFDPSGGNLNVAGQMYLVVDANNDGNYVAGQDYVVQLTSVTGTLTLDDFI